MATKKISKEEAKPVVAYKGFDQKLQCRGFQFEVGKTYEHEGEVKACASGFHSCEYPLDVFGYYNPADSRFAVVKASGQISRHGDDSKVASAIITVEAEIGLPVLVARAVDWVMDNLDKTIEQTLVTGDRSAATNTGYQSAAEVKGADSVAVSLGIHGRARGSAGNAIVLCYRDEINDRLIHIRASKVGENGIKPDTWYMLDKEGEFVEVAE